MADEIITKQELIDAKPDVKSLGEAANGNETGIVIPRYGAPYLTAPAAIQKIQIDGANAIQAFQNSGSSAIQSFQTNSGSAITTFQNNATAAITKVESTGGFISAPTLTALQAITPEYDYQLARVDATGDEYRWNSALTTPVKWESTGRNFLTETKAYVDSVPKNEQSFEAAVGGLRNDRYVSAQAFKFALDYLLQQKKAEVAKLNENYAKLQLKLQNLESINNETLAKLDAFKNDIIKADYYISAEGSDSNSGTINSPFRSFAPILAMSSGSLDNKIIAIKCGGTYTSMDISILNASNCLITSYGNSVDGRPFFDCTALITESWTEHESGIWKVTLTHNADSKIYPNFFKSDIPVQKVTSIAALASASDNAVYADNQTANTFTVYMKSTTAPSGIRWSKYGSAITLNGAGSVIDNIHALGNAHQDGALVIKSPNNSGGCKLSRCRVDWGNRHSALVGSGSRTSIAEFNEFYGGADDVETGNVLNPGGGANALVFNTPDHQTATCIDRYNTYDGLTRPNYNSPSTSTYFTCGYGHDAVEGRPMLKYVIEGNTYRNVELCHSTSASTGSMKNCTFDNVSLCFNSDDANTNYTLSNCVGNLEQLVRGTNLNMTLLWKDNEIVVKELARGTAGFVRYAEGTGSINLTYDGGVLDVRGARAASAPDNKVINRLKNGSIKVNNLKVLPIMATPFKYFTDIISGGSVTINTESGGNTYPIGTVFRRNGTEYNLAGWVGTGYEQDTSKRHDLPPSSLKDDFSRTDKLLVDDVYVNNGGVTTSLAIRNNKVATLNGSTQVAVLGAVESQDIWCRKITQSTVGSSGIALLAENDTNFIIVRETSSQYQLQVCNAGAFDTKNGSGVTPAVGQEVIAVIKTVIDPATKVVSKRAWLVADNRNVIQSEAITMPTAMSNTKNVGFVGRGASNPLLSDASWGILS